MKQRLIIHIGMHKTGSSSIQRFLSRNRLLLRAFGLLYPASHDELGRRQPKHSALFTAISNEADHGAPHRGLGSAEGQVMALADQISASRCQTAIISAEGLSGERPVFSRALAPLADRFDVTIVAFLRRHDFWAESFYKQMVLSREVRESRSFADFLDLPATKAHMRFATIMSWWADTFGQSALRVAPFEKSDIVGPVHRFIALAGLPGALRKLPHVDTHQNPGLPAAAIDIVRHANAEGHDVDVTQLPQLAKQMEDNSSAFLTENQRRQILLEHEDDDHALLKYHQPMGRNRFFAQHVNINASRAIAWNVAEAEARSALFLPNLTKN